MTASIVWLRRDLRLADHAALAAACARGGPVVVVYIHAPDEEAPWEPGAATRWWLHHSLAALDGALRRRGSRLLIRRGPSLAALEALIAEIGAGAVYWHRVYEPALRERDTAIKAVLRARGLVAESFPGELLAEPWTVATGAGEPYRVFSPYWRKMWPTVEVIEPLAAPARIESPEVSSVPLAELGLLPTIPWDSGFAPVWQPGEAGAHAALARYQQHAAGNYSEDRNRPDLPGTSRLSPHLHFGEITPRQIVHALLAGQGPQARVRHEHFLRELGWRDFGYHLLYHYPHTTTDPLNAGFAAFPWAEPRAELLEAWQRGRTGIPIVDAGMRELWETGWMHNRVRMIVASFLTKNLRYHWLHGARWFWDTLVDADLANNTQGWQWSAGSGADAAPYFRIFAPVAQGERFDPAGDYVRRCVPELAKLPPNRIHQPWSLGGVRGYPAPIVDLKASREAALAAYAQMRGEAAVG
jgi:deoxyribodipyrimidine photo-lyase